MRALLVLAVLVPLLATSTTHADPADRLDDAIDAVRDSGGRCARSLLPELQDVRQGLQDGEVARARHHVDKILERAEEWCSRDARHALHRLRDSLEDAGADRDAAPPPPRTFTVVSSIDLQCLQALHSAYAYGVTTEVMSGWLKTCRRGYPDDCTPAAEANASCEATVTGMMTYQLSDDDRTAVAQSCQTLRCPVAEVGQSARTQVDMQCFAQRRSSYPYVVDADRVLGWLQGCRNSLPAGTCKTVTWSFDTSCASTARNAVNTTLAPDAAEKMMTACMKIENLCQ